MNTATYLRCLPSLLAQAAMLVACEIKCDNSHTFYRLRLEPSHAQAGFLGRVLSRYDRILFPLETSYFIVFRIVSFLLVCTL